MGKPVGNRPCSFRVVCLCGSAGALDAYRSILRKLPTDTGMALVILSHRSPGDTSLPLLLRACTDMPVLEVEEGMPLEPNCVFLMPPRVHMTITGHMFHLQASTPHQGWPRSIGAFLLSLAASVGPRAVAVILSGMSSDGSSALHAVKAAGGTTLAQSGAAFPTMPQYAIATGYVDYILSAAQIAAYLSIIVAHRGISSRHLP